MPSLEEHERNAELLFAALQAGENAAQWRVKWEHPRFRGKGVEEVRVATLTLDDARMVIAQSQSLDTWDELCAFTRDVAKDEFEAAVDAVVDGDIAKLRAMISANPDLVRARSTRRHHCTLLHYLGANGVEGERQKTPPNAVEIAKLLLDAGAEPDALADLYGGDSTTMGLLVSSCHPAAAGLQIALAVTLLDYGAALDDNVLTALQFGYLDTAEALAKRGGRLSVIVAAGLGRLEETARLLPDADARSRHAALAVAAMHGHADVVRLLLDAGEDPNRYNPDGFHSHATPLHHAALSNQMDVVRLLVERGARLDIKDTLYSGTPLDWAVYEGRNEVAEYLRTH